MGQSKLERLVRRLQSNSAVEALAPAPARLPDCLSLVEVVEAPDTGLSSQQQIHIGACERCQRALKNYLRMQCPEKWQVVRWMLRREFEPWAAALASHVQECGCERCSGILRSTQKVSAYLSEMKDRIGDALAVFGGEFALVPQESSFAGEEDTLAGSRRLAAISDADTTVWLDTMAGTLYLSAMVKPANDRIGEIHVLIFGEHNDPEWHTISLLPGPGLASGSKALGTTRPWLARAGTLTAVVLNQPK